MRAAFYVFVLCLGINGFSAEAEPKSGVRYKRAKDINFDELLIQGKLKRPEMTIVTGETRDTTDGLLRLREDFLDRMAQDSGEELK